MQIYTSYTRLKKRATCARCLGDTIVGVVKIATPHRRIGKHEICKCLIIRDALPLIRLMVVELNLLELVVLS